MFVGRGGPDRLLPAGKSFIARGFGLGAIVKRIGDAETLALALEAGADYIQGFATGQPEATPQPGLSDLPLVLRLNEGLDIADAGDQCAISSLRQGLD